MRSSFHSALRFTVTIWPVVTIANMDWIQDKPKKDIRQKAATVPLIKVDIFPLIEKGMPQSEVELLLGAPPRRYGLYGDAASTDGRKGRVWSVSSLEGASCTAAICDQNSSTTWRRTLPLRNESSGSRARD